MILSENEKRDAIKLIEAGKPLPEKYRFLLFDESREVELLWNGKTNEVTNTVLPFQVIEQIDEPRSNDRFGIQASLFDDSGRQISGWTNKLIWGDNKLILSSLKNGPMRKEIEAQGGLKLIYIDPPFDVGADFSMDIEIGDESFTKKPSVIEEIAYRDTWGKGADSFIAMIYERLKLMHGLLAEDGSIYVHCDWRVSAYIRLLLDEIFGKNNFLNEIIWHHPKIGVSNNKFTSNTDTVFLYSKSDKYNFNFIVSEKPNEIFGRFRDIVRNNKIYYRELKNKNDGISKSKIRQVQNELGRDLSDDDVIIDFNLDKNKKRVDNVWKLSYLKGNSEEYLPYPTQKPEKFIENIIKASSSKGDLIADFFVGSGTTLAVAEKLGRKWIGSDLGKFGIHTTRKRMIDVQRQLKKDGKDFRAFEILNVGKYERDNFVEVNDDLRAEQKAKQAKLKEDQFVRIILEAYKAEPVESFANIVGKKRDRLIAVGPINTPVSSRQIQEIVDECKEKNLTKVDVLGFDYEMGIDFQDYANQGIDVQFKIIPKEVFDKRAVERGHVKFYDVAFIEVNPIIKGPANNKELSIELKDFSVFYSQEDIDETSESLKAGSSKIIVDNGQVIKITKDKNTDIVDREVLTTKWSDWIDYWAVDFDFASRKEIIKVVEEDGSEKEVWTGDYIFDNEWQSFRTKKNRNLELVSAPREIPKGKRKVAVKVVDIFGNDTTRVFEVEV